MAAITDLSPFAFSIFFGAISTFIVATMVHDWRKKKRIISSLGRRLQLNDEQFAKLFSSPHLANIAVRARRVLSQNLEMQLDGLATTDRLNEDLNAELPANPDLFWELEREFGIKTNVDAEDESHARALEGLITFQDLVDYLENKIANRAKQSPPCEHELRKP